MESVNIEGVKLIPIEKGFAQSAVNTTIFRHDSITTFKDIQIVSYFDAKKNVMLAKRKLGSESWEYTSLGFKGNVLNAHNSISLGHDGAGTLHVVYDNHNSPLNYSQSLQYIDNLDFPKKKKQGKKLFRPGIEMTGVHEETVTYPEFYRSSKGELYMFCREGETGNGNLNIKKRVEESVMDGTTKRKHWAWFDLQVKLIDGQGERSPYWQACVDKMDNIHISWCWRETSDRTTNHDICYAVSKDGGNTWLKSTGEEYSLPITQENAEVICPIAQNRSLMNQTTMTADSNGNPYIACMWAPEGKTIAQIVVLYNDGDKWDYKIAGNRSIPLNFVSDGDVMQPGSRPLILLDDKDRIFIIIREEERNYKISALCCESMEKNLWFYEDLTDFGVDAWEPSYDKTLWDEKGILNLFVQASGNINIDKYNDWDSQMIYILEWDYKKWAEQMYVI